MSTRFSAIIAVTAVLFCTWLPLSRIPFFDFVAWDDGVHVFNNPYFQTFALGGVAHFWLHPYEQLYIPVSYTAFWLLCMAAHLSGTNPQLTNTGALFDPHVFHTANLCLHLLNTSLVFFLLRRLTRQDLPSALGALLFGIHPLQVETVAWISELRGLVSAAFYLLSWHCYMSFAERGGALVGSSGKVNYALSFVYAALAMLSKPSATTISFVIAATAVWAFGRSWKSALIEASPYFAFGLILILETSRLQNLPPGQVVALWLRPLIACDALCFYMWKFIAPVGLAMDYGRTPTSVLSRWWTYVLWIIPTVVTIAIIKYGKKAPYLLYASTFAVSALLPVLGLTPFVFQFYSTTADRYVYLPIIGIGIAVAFSLAALKGAPRRLASISAAVWLVVLGVLCYNQTLVWQDSESLFTHAIAVNPDSAVAQNNLGWVLQQQNLYQQAEYHYLRAVQLAPNEVRYCVSLGEAYGSLGDLNRAETQFRRAETLSARFAAAHSDLGVLLLMENRDREGVSELITALQLDPSQFHAAEELGAYYAKKGDYNSAVAVFGEGARSSPQDETLWRDLAFALCDIGRPDEAISPLDKAISLNPSDQVAKSVLAGALNASSGGRGPVIH